MQDEDIIAVARDSCEIDQAVQEAYALDEEQSLLSASTRTSGRLTPLPLWREIELGAWIL